MMSLRCWARCRVCKVNFELGCVVPCPLSVYIAALKAARCPTCGKRDTLDAYEPGRRPPR